MIRNNKLSFNMRKRVVIGNVVVIVILLFISLANAASCEKFIGSECAELQWEKNTPGVGEVAEIAISSTNPEVMCAGFDANAHTFYKSKDGGKNWRRIDGIGDHTQDLAISSKNPNIVYIATSEIHTTDLSIKPTNVDNKNRPFNTETQPVLSPGIAFGSGDTFSTIEIFEGDESIIYAATRGSDYGKPIPPKFFRTKDGGANWHEIPTNLPIINVVSIDPKNADTIYLGSSDGIYVSFDGGVTINRLRQEFNVISIEIANDGQMIVAATPNNVIRSLDGGKNWQDVTDKLSDIHRVRIARSNLNILYASTFNGVFRSNDKGNTWNDASGNLKGKNIHIVTIHPTDPDTAFIGHSSLWGAIRARGRYNEGLLSHQGIFKTEDGGNTWKRSDNGIEEYNFEEVAVNPSLPYEAWFEAIASVGGHKTNDAGQNWRLAQLPTLHYPMRIEYSLQDKDKIFATSRSNIGISKDGGVNWQQIESGIFFQGVERGKSLYRSEYGSGIHLHGLEVNPNDDNILYAGSVHDKIFKLPLEGAHIFKSEDGGKTWKESDEGFPHEKHTAIHDITVDPKSPNVIYVATTEHEAEVGIGIYKSTDAGKAWKSANNGLDSLNVHTIIVHPKNTYQLIAATGSGLYKSINGGETWTKKTFSDSFDVEYVIDNPDIVYASTHNGVLKSRDFSDTWYKVNYGLPEGEGQGIGVDKTGKVIYAAVRDKGLYIARLTFISESDLPSERGRGFGYGPQSDRESQLEESPAQENAPFVGEQIDYEEIEEEKPNIFIRIINFFKKLFE